MIKFFEERKLKKVSIYNRILHYLKKGELEKLILSENSGEYELKMIRGEKINRTSSPEINGAIDAYYDRNSKSIEEISRYFKDHRALEVERNIISYLSSQIYFDEQRLLGLSILLMRDSTVVEAVKFGILLSEYYPLVNAKGAIEIIVNLSKHSEYTYYGVRVLKNLPEYEKYLEEIEAQSFGIGKEIIGEMK